MKYFIFCLLLFPFFLTASDFSSERKLNLSAKGIDKLKIDCGSGFLKLRGTNGLESIQVSAEIVSQDESPEKIKKFIEDYLILTLEGHGSTAHLTSKVKSTRAFFSGYSNIQINLTVEIPKLMDLDIHDGSGETEIENIDGDVDVDDGSGTLTLRNIKGHVEIEDGSGGINVRGVTGDVEIEDGSGSIDVEDVGGDVDVDDGSGSIHITNVEKDVIIRESGSGGVSISDVRGKIYCHDED